MKLFSFVICTATIIAFASCNSDKKEAGETTTTSSFNLDSAKAEIAASNAVFSDGFMKNDSSLYISRYTKDGCIMPANSPRLCGSEQLAAFFSGGYAMGIRNVKLTTDEVMGGPDVVTETGQYEILDAAGKSLDKGKFIVAWKQEDGKWKMYRDIWTTDAPMPAVK